MSLTSDRNLENLATFCVIHSLENVNIQILNIEW